MALVHLNFESQCVNGNTDLNIILPDKPRNQEPSEFYVGERKYKVLWLLHGTYGDYTDWIRKSNIELYACESDLIVVMPSAMNSDYSNWDKFMLGYSMFDYLTDELMPLVYNWFPASDQREDNFIAGLSMGGGGALKYALYHPDKFTAAAVLSYAPNNWSDPNSLTIRRKRFENQVANVGSFNDFLQSKENIWDRLTDCKVALPRLYCAVGTQDFMYPPYLKFKEYAAELGLDIKFEEIEDYAHEWRFWDYTIQRVLDFFGLDKRTAGNPF